MSNNSAAKIQTIVAVAHDIGGAQAVYPVIPKLRKRPRLRVNAIAGGFAQKVFARIKAENTETDWSDTKIDAYLDRTQPDLVLSGTSWKSCLEQGFRNRARLRNIPSVVVIDFWSDHPRRWHDADYRFEEGKDRVCVPDTETAESMVRYGYPKELLYVTGQPHLERCFQRAAVRESHPPARTEITVLFLTIALAALKLEQDPVAQIRVVCQALGRWSVAVKKQIILTIRPHPHENPPPDFLQRIQAFAPSGVTVRMADRTQPIQGQLKKSDLVLGHITMGLFEARSLGKQAIALEVTDHPPELVTAMENAGIAFLPFDADRIASFLCHPKPNSNDLGNLHRGAAAAVAKVCLDLIKG
jgi:Monogalactosyldiacylglycerol (MGDG) synthase